MVVQKEQSQHSYAGECQFKSEYLCMSMCVGCVCVCVCVYVGVHLCVCVHLRVCVCVYVHRMHHSNSCFILSYLLSSGSIQPVDQCNTSVSILACLISL